MKEFANNLAAIVALPTLGYGEQFKVAGQLFRKNHLGLMVRVGRDASDKGKTLQVSDGRQYYGTGRHQQFRKDE